MKPLMALYLKELKDHRNLCFFLLIATVSLDFYAFFEIDGGFEDSASIRNHVTQLIVLLCVSLPVFASTLIPPFMLARSFSSEWKAETYHLAFSLPIRKGWIAFSKWLAVLTIGVVLFTVSTLGGLLVYWKIAGAFAEVNYTKVSTLDFWFVGGGWYLSVLLLLLGIVSCLEGLKFSVKRWRRLVSAGFLVFCFYFLMRVMRPAIEALSFLGEYQIAFIDLDGAVSYQGVNLSWFAFPLLCGSLLLFLGLYLFDRYVEI